MPTSDEYRKIAEEYYRLAREAKTEMDRLVLLDLAKTWLEAASREITSERTAEAQKLAREWKLKSER
jgi:DNA invertase Pin-like site-specific DNA recombinase